MAIVEILKYPNPALQQVADEVRSFDQALHALLDDLADTMYANQGIGLAATQIGVMLRAIVVDLGCESEEQHGQRMDLVNPRIVWSEGKTSSEEGCLSLPGYRDFIPRSEKVMVQAVDRHGKEVEINAHGLLSYCLQHEIDHLNGVLIIDRLSRLKRELFRRWYKRTLQSR